MRPRRLRARAASRRGARRRGRATRARPRPARRRARSAGSARGRARRASRAGSPVAQHRADAALACPLDEQRAERDVAGREAAVPEEDPLVVPLAAGHAADDDVAELTVERLPRQQPAVDVLAQRAEAAAGLALLTVVD